MRPLHSLGVVAVMIAAAAATTVGSGGCRERGRPDPNIRMAVSHDREPSDARSQAGTEAGAPAAGDAPKVPTRLEVPPEVMKAWSGIRLRWKDATTGKEGTLDVPIGSAAPIPGSDLQIRADVYLPAFTMSGEVLTSSGVEPENPAARVAVGEKGQTLFEGWLFTRFPDVHPFQHPRYSIRLEGGVRRALNEGVRRAS